MKNFTFSNYMSPFTWRYGTDKMRRVFSEQYKYELWREIWVALAKAQSQAGLVSKEELADLIKHKKNIDVETILEHEKELKHDVVAAIKEFSQKAKKGGGKIHLGATSMDIVDNADMLRIMQAMELIKVELLSLLRLFSKLIDEYADFVCMGYTHLQP